MCHIRGKLREHRCDIRPALIDADFRDRPSRRTRRVDSHEQLCLYFPDVAARQRAMARLAASGVEPVESHPYWAATGPLTYRDPDGREVVFAPFVFAVSEPAGGDSSGEH
jgi:hypothetical protein